MDTPSPTGPDRVIRLVRFFSYPKQVIYLLISFLALVSLVHYFSLAQKYLRARRSTRARSKAGWYTLVPYAIIDTLRAVLFRWTIPVPFGYSLNIAEVGFTVGYLAVLLTWTFVNTTTVTGIKVEPHYYANRAGTIAASQLPLVTALGMRNNLVSYLTGVSYDKLNYLHRIAFRSLIVLIWIHAGGRMTVGLLDDEALTSRWVQCGLLAAITLVVMSILTLRPLRKLSYEVFLVIHFVFAFIFLLSVYFHLTGRDLTYYGAWPAMIVWGTDRFIRLVKLALFNLPSLLSRSRSTMTNDKNYSSTNDSTTHPAINDPTRLEFKYGYNARVEILPSSVVNTKTSASISSTQNETETDAESFLKLTIRVPSLSHSNPLTALINPLHTWRPGQSVYLSVPSLAPRGWWPFEAHPFTIANVRRTGEADYPSGPGILAHGDVDEEKGWIRGDIGNVNLNANLNANRDASTDANAANGDIYLTFFIRVREGFTKRLFDSVRSSSASHEATHASTSDTTPTLYTNVVLNGPYSAPPVLVGYERVVLIAGGSGVAFTLPLLLGLIAKSHTPHKSGCKRVLFIWAIRDASQISWIAPLLHPALAALSQSSTPPPLEIDIRFYITSTITTPISTGSNTPPSLESTASLSGLPNLPRTPSPDFQSKSKFEGTDMRVDADVVASRTSDNPTSNLEFTSDTINISTNKGRPDIARILKGEINGYEGAGEGECVGAGGVVSVNVCGPVSLITATRAALRVPRPLDIMNGAPRVVLHVEAFGGA